MVVVDGMLGGVLVTEESVLLALYVFVDPVVCTEPEQPTPTSTTRLTAAAIGIIFFIDLRFVSYK